MFETVEIIGAAAWASALVNGDWSGLDASEAATLADWIDRHNGAEIVDVERDESGEPLDPFFSWRFGFHTGHDSSGGDCLVYIALK